MVTDLARGVVIASLLLPASGCFLDRTGLGDAPDAGADAGARLDAGDAATGADAGDSGVVDGCSHRGRSRSVATLGASELRAGTTSDAVIDEPGVLALPAQTFAHGALLWTGYETALLDDGTPQLSDLSGATPRFSALRVDHSVDFGLGRPAGLDVNGDDTYTIEIVGEVFLRAGANSFELRADDRMVIAIDLGGSIATGRAYWTGGSTLDVTAPADGWYPLHAAYEEEIVGASFRISLRGPADGDYRDLRPEEMRVSLADVEGRVAFGWDFEGWDAAPAGSRIDTDPTDVSFATTEPREVGITDRSTFGLRWFGMHRFDTAGGVLDVSVEKRFHLWVDGIYFGDGDGSGTYEADFTPGWHEVSLLMTQDGGNDGRAGILYDGDAFTSADLRARSRAGGAIFGEGVVIGRSVDVSADDRESILVDAPAIAASFVEVSAIVEAADATQVTLSWVGPGVTAASARLADGATRITGTDLFHFRAVVDDVAAPDGAWDLSISNASAAPIRWERAGVLVHSGGTREAYPRLGEWTSAPIALGDDLAIDRLAIDARRPAGTRVRMQVRAAESEAALGAAALVDVDADGWVSRPAIGRFAQVRVILEGDGTVSPRVLGLELFARPCVTCAAERCGPWSTPGAIALYALDEGIGTVVRDTAGPSPPLDAELADASGARWTRGALVFERPTLVEGQDDATRAASACAASGEVSLEAWVTPAVDAVGEMRPGRILAISADRDNQNVLLGEEPDGAVTARVATSDAARTELTTAAGLLTAGALHHVVFTRSTDGAMRVYVDGAMVATDTATGDLSAWRATDRVVMGDERVDGDRSWLGALHLAAIYDRALSDAEIAAHYAVGPDGGRL